jgi:hypothetical protein
MRVNPVENIDRETRFGRTDCEAEWFGRHARQTASSKQT